MWWLLLFFPFLFLELRSNNISYIFTYIYNRVLLLIKMNLLQKYNNLSNNLFTLLSYNKRSINISTRIIRLKIIYLFFYINKKISMIKIYKKYKLYKLFISISSPLTSLKKVNLYYKANDFYFSLFSSFFFSFYNFSFFNVSRNGFFFFNNVSWYYFSFYLKQVFIKKNTSLSFKLKHLNYFFHLYKKYNYVLYIWFYSIKYLKFFNFSWGGIKTRQKRWVLLRSPHTNKKSKETFKLRKIKQAMFYPSFLYSKNTFFLKHVIHESVLLKNKISYFKI